MAFKKNIIISMTHSTHLQLTFAEIVAEKIIFGEHEVELEARGKVLYILNRGGFFTTINSEDIASITEGEKEIWNPETESIL